MTHLALEPLGDRLDRPAGFVQALRLAGQLVVDVAIDVVLCAAGGAVSGVPDRLRIGGGDRRGTLVNGRGKRQ